VPLSNVRGDHPDLPVIVAVIDLFDHRPNPNLAGGREIETVLLNIEGLLSEIPFEISHPSLLVTSTLVTAKTAGHRSVGVGEGAGDQSGAALKLGKSTGSI
jgi:hypothetical protein